MLMKIGFDPPHAYPSDLSTTRPHLYTAFETPNDLGGHLKVSFGQYTLEQETGELWNSNEPQRLAPQPAKLLLLLVERAGSLVLREEIKQLLWNQETFVDFDQSLNACIRQIRSALSDNADKPTYIETLPKRGYRFIAPITREYEVLSYTTPDVIAEVVNEAPSAAAQSKADATLRSKRWLPIAVSACIFLIAASTFYIYYRSVQRHHVLASATPAEIAIHFRPSLAVLSLENTSGQPKDAWLSSAIAEMLTNDLNSDDRLRIVPREDIAQANRDLGLSPATGYSTSTLEALHRALGSDLIAHGFYSLDSASPNAPLHLTLQIQEVSTGKARAEISETGHLNDLFALVNQSGDRLRNSLFAGQKRLAEDPHTLAGLSSSTEAIRLYTEGLKQSHDFDTQSARSFFERAIKADPDFALAHVQLADSWSDLGYVDRAKQEAAEAFRLSNALPRPQKLSIEALYRDSSGDVSRAISIYKALATFYPDEAEWGLKLGVTQHEAGQYQDAINTLEGLRYLPLTPSDEVELDRDESWSYIFLGPPHEVENQQKARDIAVAGVEVARKQGGKLILARALRSECSVLLFVKPPDAAIDVCAQARSLFEAVGNLDAVAAVTNNLAVIQQGHGNFAEALTGIQQAEHLYHEIGNLHDEIAMLENEALLNLAIGNLSTAIQQGQAVTRSRNTGADKDYASEGNRYMALGYNAQGSLKEARATCKVGLDLAKGFPDVSSQKYAQAEFLELQGDADAMAGDFDQARATWKESLALYKELASRTSIAEVDVDLIRLDLQQGHPREDMIKALHDDLAAFGTETEIPDFEFGTRLATAQVQIALGHFADAETTLVAARSLDGKGNWVATHLQFLLAQAALQQVQHHNRDAASTLQQEIQQASAKGFAYRQLEGEIALMRLQHQDSPSPQDAIRLKTLVQEARQHGYQGLATIALASKI